MFPSVSVKYSQGQVDLLLPLIVFPKEAQLSVRDLLRSLSVLVTVGFCTTGSEGRRIYNSLTVYRILLRKKLTLEFVKKEISLI